MNNYLPRGEFRDTNTSAVYAIYSILRRQPWKSMAITTWDNMRRFLHLALIATSLGALLPTLAQARSYNVVSSDVPFKFQIGERTFKPGRYDFIMAGPGVVAMRDSRGRIVANIATRPKTTGGLANAQQAGLQHPYENCPAHPDMGCQRRARHGCGGRREVCANRATCRSCEYI